MTVHGACLRPESDFCLTPPQRNSATVVECGGDGGSALASRLSESEHIGMLNLTIPNGSAFTGQVTRRCANSTFDVLASPHLGDPGVVPR